MSKRKSRPSPERSGFEDEAGIARFIDTHGPLPESTLLPDAPFCMPSLAAFLREEILADADWAPVIDELNVDLHGSH